jgi:predicted small lipoprotein YifL
MVGLLQKGWRLNSRQAVRFARLAAMVALVAALGLAGCGRKAGLDPPPQASVAGTAAAQPDSDAGIGADGKARASKKGQKGPKEPFILDFLVD